MMTGKKMVGIALAISLIVSAILAAIIILGPSLNLDQILSFLGEIKLTDGGDKIPDRTLVGLIKNAILG